MRRTWWILLAIASSSCAGPPTAPRCTITRTPIVNATTGDTLSWLELELCR